jgi:hypothetical protein
MTFEVFRAVVSLVQADARLKLELHSVNMDTGMNEPYLASASRMFLEGSTHASPMAAVISGERSLREWCDCLAFARFLYSDKADPIEAGDEDEISSAIRV